MSQQSKKSLNPGKQQKTSCKLTKSEKKKRKLEKQQQQVLEILERRNIETVVYNNPNSLSKKAARAKSKESESQTSNAPDDTRVKVNLRKTRYEIMKFGIQSLKSKELADAETALAISLGARPNKKPAVNYKDLQIQRKNERALAKEQEASMMKPKLAGVIKKKTQGSSKKPDTRRARGPAAGRSSKASGKRHRKH